MSCGLLPVRLLANSDEGCRKRFTRITIFMCVTCQNFGNERLFV
jgi:hypothetical protein